MSVSVSKITGNIELKLTAYHNCDDVQLFWRAKVDGKQDAAIPGCLGFMIERQRIIKDKLLAEVEILRNRVGFTDGNAGDEFAESVSPSKPSIIWPFQRYDWTDHGANSGQTVRYNIKAMSLPQGKKAGEDVLSVIAESGWTEPIEVSAYSGKGISAFFNRGMVMSQYVGRIVRKNNWKPEDIVSHVKELEDPLRVFLSGELRIEMLKIITEVFNNKDVELYAALYELNDKELIDGLKSIGKRAHILLANGSDKKHDGNLAARGELIGADVDVRDRLLRGKGLGHNKFAVVASVNGDEKSAIKVWTGSTNWSFTGLCTQLNNGILIEDPAIAEMFLKQWNLLDNAGNCFTKKLIDANDRSPQSSGSIDVWFAPMHNNFGEDEPGPDLKELIEMVLGAKRAILFVMFEPGEKSKLVSSILGMPDNIYVRGVKNTVANSSETFSLHEKGTSQEFRTRVIQPEGIKKDFSGWIGEVTREQFITTGKNKGIGHAITHAKMIVIDPLDEDCKIITGSHNFSKSASEKNDENFVVIHGNKPLAEAYAVSCLATYSHYRWRAYLKETASSGKIPWSHLSDNPIWQAKYLSSQRKKHLDLWCPW